jgi:hypothetical protein
LRKKILRPFIFVTFLLLFSPLYAQDMFIDWSEGQRSAGSMVDILPDKGLNFYTWQWPTGQLVQVPRSTRYVNGMEVTTKKIEQRIGENVMVLDQLTTFNGHLLAFLRDKRDGNHSLYMVNYDSEIDPYGEPRFVTTYGIPKGWNNKGHFNLIKSANGKFLCVEYIIPGKASDYERYGYKVYDTAFAVLSEGEYEIPYTTRQADVDVRYLSDAGDYMLGISIFGSGRNSVWRDYSAIEKTVVVQVSGNELYQYELDIDGKRVFDFGLNARDSVLSVTGTYGAPFSNGAEGVFLQRINLRERKITAEYFDPFPESFLSDNAVSTALDPLFVKQLENGNGPKLFNYAIRGVYTLGDGATVVLAEQFFIFLQSSNDLRGITQSVNHYNYNDLVAFRINSDGRFSWMVNIPKEQHSVNDNGYYSSVVAFCSENSIDCFFNDHSGNYDETGNYRGFLRSVTFPVRKSSYAFAHVSLDLQSGTVSRRILNTYEQSGGMIVTKMTSVDLSRRELIFFSSGREDRFGLLKY